MSEGLNRADLLSFAGKHRAEYEALLRQFVETPSVSVDPAHAGDIQKAADLALETLRKFGGKARLYRVDKGNPVIHGSLWRRQESPDRYGLQPHGRATGLEGN